MFSTEELIRFYGIEKTSYILFDELKEKESFPFQALHDAFYGYNTSAKNLLDSENLSKREKAYFIDHIKESKIRIVIAVLSEFSKVTIVEEYVDKNSVDIIKRYKDSGLILEEIIQELIEESLDSDL